MHGCMRSGHKNYARDLRYMIVNGEHIVRSHFDFVPLHGHQLFGETKKLNPAVSRLMFIRLFAHNQIIFSFFFLLSLLLSSTCWSSLSLALFRALMLQTKATRKQHLTHLYILYISADDGDTNCRTWTGEAKPLLNNKQNEPRTANTFQKNYRKEAEIEWKKNGKRARMVKWWETRKKVMERAPSSLNPNCLFIFSIKFLFSSRRFTTLPTRQRILFVEKWARTRSHLDGTVVETKIEIANGNRMCVDDDEDDQ